MHYYLLHLDKSNVMKGHCMTKENGYVDVLHIPEFPLCW